MHYTLWVNLFLKQNPHLKRCSDGVDGKKNSTVKRKQHLTRVRRKEAQGRYKILLVTQGQPYISVPSFLQLKSKNSDANKSKVYLILYATYLDIAVTVLSRFIFVLSKTKKKPPLLFAILISSKKAASVNTFILGCKSDTICHTHTHTRVENRL